MSVRNDHLAEQRVLIANRGEIAVRIARAAADLGMRSVAVYSQDDAECLHVRRADHALALPGRGAAAYLDAAQLVHAAREAGCRFVHPGYGMLSESAAFARACDEAGLVFVGPRPEALDELGDKTRARALAARLGVPLVHGTSAPTSLEQARELLAALAGAPLLVKAVFGGGGRGMRIVRTQDELAPAFERCAAEAKAAFGDGALYVEELLPRARHIEVQVVGDGHDVVHLYERECTLQRRHQKLIELAPSVGLDPTLRQRILDAALELARALQYRGLGTFEFLVDASTEHCGRFVFIEANPRLQVEHTVTEAVTGVDLVRLQLELAAGHSLRELGFDLARLPAPRGVAMQLRVNMETLAEDGSVLPASGTLRAFEPPGGPFVRVDSHAYAGYTPSTAFDSLLAKVIVHAPEPSLADVLRRGVRALRELRIEGLPSNVPFLLALLEHEEVRADRVYTRFVEDHAATLASRAHALAAPPSTESAALAGSRPSFSDPLAVLQHGKSGAPAVHGRAAVSIAPEITGPPGTLPVRAPMQGTIVSLEVAVDSAVHRGQPVLVMEAMKMQHVIGAPASGIVRAIGVGPGDTVREGHALAFLAEGEVEGGAERVEHAQDLDAIRPDLAEVIQRHAYGLDRTRVEATAKRHAQGHRTARENVADLCDAGSFVEYGPLVIAAQRRRRPEQELIERTPADGLVGGVGRVNSELLPSARTDCVVMSYDYAVMAGTQGLQNHRKKDRLFELAERQRLPVVLFAEGGGGRPGDTDGMAVSGLDCMAFHLFGKLSGLVPLVGIGNGRCFAGNAALLGSCDVVIATRSANIGMGGPAMIEGGGLGVYRPEEIGPIDVQRTSGVVDIAVRDEAEAVAVAKRYLAFFQGALPSYEHADQRELRFAIPENRLRVYEVRKVMETLFDTGSMLELRRDFGRSMVTALARVEGRTLGVIANDPSHLGGAIDADAADKAARFMQLCDAFDVPILFLCDTPGIMVGPDAEATGLVRHAARLFVVSGSLSVPFFTIVLRKGYGLGAQTMAGGSFKAPVFCVAWPTAEFGGMGLEGAVKLAFRKELAAIEDPVERKRAFDAMVFAAYAHGKGTNTASYFEIDDVIDPVDSRQWIATAMRSAPPPVARAGKKRPCIDTW